MYLGRHAQNMPDKAAAINATTGVILTYGNLNQQSIQLVRLRGAYGTSRRSCGVVDGKQLAFFEVVWAALRSGLYIAINCHLPLNAVSYIINDCGAKSIVSFYAMQSVTSPIAN